MPTLTITLDGVDLKDIPLSKPRTTLGRRPYNDIVVDNLAVSGEHAVFVLHPDGVEVLDLHSTNGTYLNGKAVVSARVQPDDVLEIGRYKLRLQRETASGLITPGPMPSAAEPPPPSAAPHTARIRVLSGPAAGKEMALTKVVTTLGKPGVAVAAINHRGEGYTITRVDGDGVPTVNGQPVGAEPLALKANDLIELAGTQMRFLLD
ncbi:FHA domain-containing protein [Macromonas nakdongensis]|uniref:FHA domain-containing protein n=1 Tax=Macromonas nakdongensis TaxID=1843082 RepID=UPI000C338124|nr:FHA domain-containing protein [Macromonas nakdongensis]